MEEWQINHIKNNITQLINLTICNNELLTILRSKNIIAEMDYDLISSKQSSNDKTRLLYTILMTRHGSYNILVTALKITRQSGAVDILLNHNPLNQNLMALTYDKHNVVRLCISGATVYGGKFGGRDVAVKVQSTQSAKDEIAHNEIKILLLLDFHPHIIRYFTANGDDDFIYTVLELCLTSLEDEIKKDSMLLDPSLILKKCTEGLNHLHKHNVIHANLSPANILFTTHKEVKLAEFGLSKVIPVECSYADVSVACYETHIWLAPEVLECLNDHCDVSAKLSFKTDVFSLGCICYFTLTKGQHPFGITTAEIQFNIINGKVNFYSSNLSYGWQSLIEKMIFDDPSKRPLTDKILSNKLVFGTTECDHFENKNIGKKNFGKTCDLKPYNDPLFHQAKSNNDLCTNTKTVHSSADNRTIAATNIWETTYIKMMLPKLIDSTQCDARLLDHLQASGVLMSEEVQRVIDELNVYRKARLLYHILKTRKDSYNKLISALEETMQTGARSILLNNNAFYIDFMTITYDKNSLMVEFGSGIAAYGGKFGGRQVLVKVQSTRFIEAEKFAHNEIKQLLMLDFHPNIVRYFAADYADDKIYTVLELCTITLYDYIKMKKMVVEDFVILKESTGGLNHLHRHSVIHGNLTPASILFTVHNKVKLADFGLSEVIPTGCSSVETSNANTKWTAPEILKGLNLVPTMVVRKSFQTDVFSLGCIYYYILTKGQHPFGETVEAQFNIIRGNVNLQNSKIEEGLLLLIEKMICDDPSKRLSTEEILRTFLHTENSFTSMLNAESTDDIFPSFDAHTWQKYCLRMNEMTLTQCVSSCPEILGSPPLRGYITDFYFNQAIRYGTYSQVTDCLLTISFVKRNFYDIIMTRLKETNQTSAVALLESSNQLNEKWKPQNVNVIKTDFNSLTEFIVYNGDILLFQNYLDRKGSTSSLCQISSEYSKETLLHIAVGCGRIEIIEYLLSIGADINSKDLYGCYPLHYLGWFGGDAVAVTKVLLKHGSDLLCRNTFGDTVAHDICRYLSPNQYHTWLNFIVDIERTSIFNDKNNMGRTPALNAVYTMEITTQSIELLSKMGNVDYNHSDNNGMTFIMLAAYGGQNRAVLECIVRQGGDWTFKNKDGETVLHCSVKGGNIDAIKYFLSLGADPNAKCHNGFTPLHYVCYSYLNHKDMTKLLIESKADLFAMTKEEDNVAHIFGNKINMEKEYYSWKEFLVNLGYIKLFEETNGSGECPP